MKIYSEISLPDFEFWSGAVYTAKQLSREDFAVIESTLEDIYPYGISDTQVNDIFWFEDDWIAEILGFEDWEDLENKRKESEE